jgi:hypothetical protein
MGLLRLSALPAGKIGRETAHDRALGGDLHCSSAFARDLEVFVAALKALIVRLDMRQRPNGGRCATPAGVLEASLPDATLPRFF